MRKTDLTTGTLAAKARRRNQGLWRFALGLYGRPGVAAACLDLQDRHDVDIPLLLAALWHGASGRGRLDASRVRAWRAHARAWRRAITPLRAARTAIRAAAKADPAIARLRQAILAAELAAEKLMLRDLETDSGPRPAAQARGTSTDARHNAAIFVRGPHARLALTKIISRLDPTT